MNKAAILEKAKKLLNLSKDKSTTEGELNAAASALSRLLETYDLKMEEVHTHIAKEDIEEVNYITNYKSMPTWLGALAKCVADPLGCHIHISYGEFIKVVFVGESVSVQIASYFFDMLYNKLYWIATANAKKQMFTGRYLSSYRNSFIIGAALEIKKRLTKEVPNTSESHTALVAVKMAAVAEFVKEHYPDIRPGHRGTNSGYGYSDGRATGKAIPLNKGVTTNHNGTKMLS